MTSVPGFGRAPFPEFIEMLTDIVLEHDFSRFFERAAGAAAKLIGADGAALIMLEDDNTLCYRFFLGVPAQMQSRLTHIRFDISEGTAGAAMRQRRSMYNADYSASPHAMAGYVEAGLRSNMIIPVLSGEHAIGVLAISWFFTPGPAVIDDDKMQLAQLLANMIGAAFHRQQLANELLRQAQHDELTGLGNRAMLAECLSHAVVSAQRQERLVAVLVMDIDGFKRINDRMGHAAGDRLLQEVANRLRDVVRRSDTIVRLGGDEFVVVLPCARNLSEINRVILRIITALKIRVTINGRTEHVSTSLGATVYPLDESSSDILIAHADSAMYIAKRRGGNQYCYFDRMLEQKQHELEAAEQDIQRGLEANEFRLFFQPIVDSRNGEVLAFEALIRWQHPAQGLLAPAAFIAVAEQTNLITEIDAWVLEAAILQLAQWQAQGKCWTLSINISARRFELPGFTEQLRMLLARYPEVDPTRLRLEIVESLAVSDLDHAAGIIDECRKLGVGCALDDFGTGYASIAYLRKLSVTVLKIDRSFVDAMLTVKEDLALVQSVIGLANIFELDCVAEGVESHAQIQALREVGCFNVQGYFIAPPMPLLQLQSWLDEWQHKRHELITYSFRWAASWNSASGNNG